MLSFPAKLSGISGAIMTSLPDFLESGEIARLIPVIADSRREQRVASVFLATLSAVPDFAESLLSSVGVRLGKRSVIDTFTEVVIGGHKESKDRPDGLIVASTGKKSWKALLEAKIGSSSLDDDQVQRYLQLARNSGIDAVITLSNQFVARPIHSPVNAPKTLTRRVDLFHWSWKMILTEAILLQTRDAIRDPDQAFILREFVRFLSHSSVGVSGFDRMPTQWREAVTLVKSGGGIAKTSPEAEAVVSAWHQEIRDLALRMSQHLAADVDVKLPRVHANDADQRLKDDCAKLAAQNKLQVDYEIPNAASLLSLTADLMSQTIRVGMEVDAPQDKQRGPARVNWLLRQFKSEPDDPLFVRIVWPSRAQDVVCRLSELRIDPKAIVGDAPQPPKSFEVFLLSDDGRRFSGRQTFIEEIERAVPHFYDAVGQHLERWVPKPPKPVAKKGEQEAVAEVVAVKKEKEERPAEHIPPAEQSGPRPGNIHSSPLDIPPFLRRFVTGTDGG
jgi:hypothetical protein